MMVFMLAQLYFKTAFNNRSIVGWKPFRASIFQTHFKADKNIRCNLMKISTVSLQNK